MPSTATARTIRATDELRRFAEELDQIRTRAEARVGADDVRAVKRLDRFSRTMEVVGRVLIHFSFEPIDFLAGVVALWLHKQLQATEIGHTALHGAYDGLPGAERFYAKTLPLGHADRRRVVAPRPQRPPPPVHQRRRPRSRHPLRPGAPDRADAARAAPPLAAAVRPVASRSRPSRFR